MTFVRSNGQNDQGAECGRNLFHVTVSFSVGVAQRGVSSSMDLSESHRAFLAAGGLGLLIGDVALNYRQEKIIEAYYSISLFRAGALTFDFQFIDNPADNADRGSVSIFAARFHDEF